MKKIAIVTGASSGIGKQTALALSKQGYTVIGGSRHIESADFVKSGGIIAHNLDVTDHASVLNFVKYVKDRFHQIDVLVNSAGYGSFGALEEVPLTEARNQMDVNLFGVVDLIQQVSLIMRQQGNGRIINISSLAGQSYSAMAGWYYISKHALETMSDVLRLELKPFGIEVVIVEPGITNTNWANVTIAKMNQVTPKGSSYRQMADKQASMIVKPSQTTNDVSRTIIKAIKADKPKIRYQVKFADKVAMIGSHLAGFKLQDKIANRMMK